MTKRLYFGHPVNTYGTELERELLRRIVEEFPEWTVVNPSDEGHGKGYRLYREAAATAREALGLTGGSPASGMGYFFHEVLPHCSGGVFLPFRDGAWGAGILAEAAFLRRGDRLIWQITPEGSVSLVGDLPRLHYLSREETVERIRHPDGKMKPY